MMDWNEYIRFARTLYDATQANISLETRYRIAISRLYYGVYHVLWAYVDEIDDDSIMLIEDDNNHARLSQIFSYLMRKRDDKYQLYDEISLSLPELRKLRNKADYDDRFPNAQLQADEAFRLADAILKALATLQNTS